MRDKETLIRKFEDIKILQQYLFMSPEHFITVKNALGAKLEIRMHENLHYYCKNMNFPEFQEMCWSDNMNNETILAIIEQLQNSKPENSSIQFSSRWEEIKAITKANVTLNHLDSKF